MVKVIGKFARVSVIKLYNASGLKLQKIQLRMWFGYEDAC